MFKTEDFNKKIIEEKKFISLIKPGSRIFISSGPGEPARAAKMITSSEKLLGYDLEIIQVVGTGDYFPDQSSSNRNYRYKTFRSGETAVEQPSVG